MDAQSRRARLVADTVVDAIQAIEDGRAPARIIATHVGHALHADNTSYGWLDVRSGECQLATWPDIIDLDSMVRVTRDVPHTHPVLHHWLVGNTGVAVVSSLVADRAAWRNSEGYALLKSGVGCTETGGIRIDDGTSTLRMIGFARHRDFTPDEIGLLEDIRRPAVALCRHAEWLSSFDREPTAQESPLQRAASVGITTRELEVLQLLAGGLLASTIAVRLSISTRTVHRHLAHIYGKLGTHDRLTTVIRAQETGLLVHRSRRVRV